jgi:two-component system sensor histidine kinase UhpB
MAQPLKILILEDSVDDAEMIQYSLKGEKPGGYEFSLAMNEKEFLTALKKFNPHIILSGNSLPQFDATEALKLAREQDPGIPFILVTGTVSDEFAASIIKQGANDYILKDRLSRLPSAIDASLKQRQVEKERLSTLNELHENNERYKIMAKAISDTIRDWDLVTDTITWNSNVQDIFGYKSVDLHTESKWWYEKIHPLDVESVRKNAISQVRKKMLRFEDEYRFQCADGSYKYVYDRSFLVIDQEGKPVRMIGAMQDITERKLLDRKITKAIISAQDQERYQIGGELHDNVTQILAGTLISLSMINSPGSADSSLYVNRCHEYIMMAIGEIRQLSHKLAPAFFKEETLKETFERLLSMMNVDGKFKIILHFDSPENEKVSNEIQLNLYRILQEQLNNITKYSGADEIKISVTIEGKNLKMIIQDNGRGFDTKKARKGIGLVNIQKRTELLFGFFSLQSSVGNGCKLKVEIPLQDVG